MNLFNTFKHSLFFLTFIPIVALANTNNNPSSLLTNPQYAVGLDLGVTKPTNLGSSTTFPIGYSTFSYGSNTSDVHAVFSGISISKIVTVAPLYTLQVGASAHYISNISAKGDLEQGISPPFYQSSYAYSISSYQYLIDAKLRRQFYDRYIPYIYLGLGVASNRAYNYSTAVPDYLTLTPEYSNRTTSSFSYSLGLGFDYLVTSKVSFGVGYRFINLGRIGLGPGVIRNTNIGAQLTQSNLYMNTLLAQINYFI